MCEFALALDEWLAPQFASSAEAHKFQRAYAQKMGLGTAATSREVAERAQAMFGRYKGIWSQIASKTKDMKGYPVKTSFAFAVGRPAMPKWRAVLERLDAELRRQHDQRAKRPDRGRRTDRRQDWRACSIRSQRRSARRCGRPEGERAARSRSAAAAAGHVPLMTMSSELLSVSTTAVDPSAFEIPADFK